MGYEKNTKAAKKALPFTEHNCMLYPDVIGRKLDWRYHSSEKLRNIPADLLMMQDHRSHQNHTSLVLLACYSHGACYQL